MKNKYIQKTPYGCGMYAVANALNLPNFVTEERLEKSKNGKKIFEGDIVKFSTRRYHLGIDKGLQTITFKIY